MEFAGSPFEIKSLDDSGHIAGVLAGYGNVDHGGDMLVTGCLAKSLAARSHPLPMLLHHDMHRPIGAWTKWHETSDGLHVSGKLTLATRDAQEAHALAKDGALTGLSIGWKPIKQSRDTKGIRVVTEAELFEGSLVTIGMNDAARVTSIKAITKPRDIADLLQEAGIPGRRAKAAAGVAWRAINDQPDEAAADAELAALIQSATARLAKGGR